MKGLRILAILCTAGIFLFSYPSRVAGRSQINATSLTRKSTGQAAAETIYLPVLIRPASFEDIAFISNRDGKSEIYTMRADGSNVQRVTYNNLRETRLAWSPDGAMLAFEDEDSSGIYVIGAGQQRVTNLTA